MDTWCEGCNFHTFPYKAQLPINTGNGYPTKTFRTEDDVWYVVDLLIEEVKNMNEQEGKSFDVAKAVSQQLPFFSCKNIIHNPDFQKDIARYMYCKEFGVSPYKDEFGKHPNKWILKSQIIKSAFHKLEQMHYDKINKKSKVN